MNNLNKILFILRPRSIYRIFRLVLKKLYLAAGGQKVYGRTQIINEIINVNDYNSFIEVGVWKGENVVTLAKTINSCNFIGVDPYSSDTYGENEKADGKQELLLTEAEVIYRNLLLTSKKLGNFKIIRKTSLEAAKDFSDESIDMIFIDAVHTYSEVKKDIEAWLPKVKSGGCLSGHDYSLGFFGVVLAVNEVLGVDNISIKSDSTWFYFKTKGAQN